VDDLVSNGLSRKRSLVKVLGNGDVEGVRLDVTAHAFSKSATEKRTAGGTTTTPVGRDSTRPGRALRRLVGVRHTGVPWVSQ
jgi:hypothetical protein